MDEQFKQDVDTFFTDRHSDILVKIKKENSQHYVLIKEIMLVQERLKYTAPTEIWLLVESLIKLLNLQTQTESKHLYIQGMEDCQDIFHFLKTEYVGNNYNELPLEISDNNQ